MDLLLQLDDIALDSIQVKVQYDQTFFAELYFFTNLDGLLLIVLGSGLVFSFLLLPILFELLIFFPELPNVSGIALLMWFGLVFLGHGGDFCAEVNEIQVIDEIENFGGTGFLNKLRFV